MEEEGGKVFDSGVSAGDLISKVRQETDIALPIPDELYLEWIGAVEQLLYSEIIRQRKKYITEDISEGVGTIKLSDITPSDKEDNVRFQDIDTVFWGTEQLIFSTLTAGGIFQGCWWQDGENLGYHVGVTSDESGTGIVSHPVTVIYFVRPKFKTDPAQNINLPREFLSLVSAYLRGQAYKIANEDALAAKWINDYNILVETFRGWMETKQARFG